MHSPRSSGLCLLYYQNNLEKLESQIKIGKERRQAKVVLSDDEAFKDDSSKQGRKLSDEEVQEKASTDTELFIQEVTPTKVIQDQGGREKASEEVCLEEQNHDEEQRAQIAEMKRLLDRGDGEERKNSLAEKMEKDDVTKETGAKRKKSIPRKSTRKRQKMEEDAEKEELKGLLDIIPREEVPIEVESISTKFPIVDWKTYFLTETFILDVEETIQISHEYGIHILLMENGLAIHMLTEKKYPLSQEMLTKMLSRKLEVDHESSQAFELLRFIRSQVQSDHIVERSSAEEED
ncbi:hypothetical protein Tco_0768292 [Tanacetum coccineum]